MVQKIICRARRDAGKEQVTEFLVRCSSNEEVMKGLSGYRLLEADGAVVAVDAADLLAQFDSTRPHRSVPVIAGSGATIHISLHTLH